MAEALPVAFNIGAIVGGAISVISGITSGDGRPDFDCSKGILGQHHPGPFDVQSVQAAYTAAPSTVRQEGFNLATLNGRCRAVAPSLSPNDALTVARILVWQAHGAENGECGSNCVPTRAYLQSLLSTYGVGEPNSTVYQPPPDERSIAERIADEAARIAGTVRDTASDVGAGVEGARVGAGANQAARDFGFGGGIGTAVAIAGVGALLFFALRRE